MVADSDTTTHATVRGTRTRAIIRRALDSVAVVTANISSRFVCLLLLAVGPSSHGGACVQRACDRVSRPGEKACEREVRGKQHQRTVDVQDVADLTVSVQHYSLAAGGACM